MFRLNLHFRTPGHDQNNIQFEKIYDYTPNKIKQLKVKVEQLNSRIAILEKSLKESEKKVSECKNIILEYDSILHEEINLYRLQKLKIETIKDAYYSYEIFMQDLENQLFSLMELSSQKQNLPSNTSFVKRIFLRFIHQKELNQKLADEKILELEKVINQKQPLLENFHSDLKRVNNKAILPVSNTKSQTVSMN